MGALRNEPRFAKREITCACRADKRTSEAVRSHSGRALRASQSAAHTNVKALLRLRIKGPNWLRLRYDWLHDHRRRLAERLERHRRQHRRWLDPLGDALQHLHLRQLLLHLHLLHLRQLLRRELLRDRHCPGHDRHHGLPDEPCAVRSRHDRRPVQRCSGRRGHHVLADGRRRAHRHRPRRSLRRRGGGGRRMRLRRAREERSEELVLRAGEDDDLRRRAGLALQGGEGRGGACAAVAVAVPVANAYGILALDVFEDGD